MVEMLSQKNEDGQPLVRASGIIATTFTKKAAAELQERVRVRLLENGLRDEANDLSNAMIGTVHSLGVNLLKRFSFEAGVSPSVQILADEDQQVMFNQSLSQVLTPEITQQMTALSNRLGLNKKDTYDWRRDVKTLTEIARANDFSKEVLEKSKKLSFESFTKFLPTPSAKSSAEFHEELKGKLEETIDILEGNEDSTKVTQSAVNELKSALNELKTRGEIFWHRWAKISKLKVGAKSKKDFEAMAEFAKTHDKCADFQKDIKLFIYQLFDLTIGGIEEYQRYKAQRGLIDYTDMEAFVKKLLSNPQVAEVLKSELDLLMVDEFQDTSPMQLEIFLKLSEFAKESVWVGDPKQSIYGFRGAAPELMDAIVKDSGGVKKENIQIYSWRSRKDVVHATNAIFVKAFGKDIPEEEVALIPKRAENPEPKSMSSALIHWHFRKDPELKRMPGKPWFENCLAEFIRRELDSGIWTQDRDTGEYRLARAGDIGVLCRSNYSCQNMAEALHRSGIKAAISRAALLQTAESTLILACLKFILNKYDTLSLAEVLKLQAGWTTKKIIEHRLDYLEEFEADDTRYRDKWAEDIDVIQRLNELRREVVELSSSELLNYVLDELDLRRTIVAWGNQEQRLANVDMLLKFALDYESACNRLHTAASLGGFLLWLTDLEAKGGDVQGSGAGPEAVNVLTYHKSKGLEYPITICHDLENQLRDDIWGIEIVAEKDEVDLNNLLGNRWLRFWANPYGDQFRGTNLNVKMLDSDDQTRKTLQARQEEARLLYVGITRARDYIVFPSREGKSTKWLNRVWNDHDDHHTLDAATSDSPWTWLDEGLKIDTKSGYFAQAFQGTDLPKETISYIQKPTGKADHTLAKIDLKKEKLGLSPKLKSISKISFAPPIELPEIADKPGIIKALNALVLTDDTNYSANDRKEIAEGLVNRFELQEWITTEKMLRQSHAYFEYIGKNFPNFELHKMHPARTFHQDRIFESDVSNLLISNELAVVIYFSRFGGGIKNIDKRISDLGDWFTLTEQAINEEFSGKPVKKFVCFARLGILAEV